VVRLDLDGLAMDIAPRQGPQLAVPKAQASNVYLNDPNFGPERAVDGDETTRWATDFGIYSAWLEVDLGKPMKIAEVRIMEAVEFGERVKKFALKCRRDSEWETVITGTKIGANFVRKFRPVFARYWRLDIFEASEGPTIYEFQLVPAK
ncbi:MAG: discoidin domain-containing protein, partial [Armatimonadetes bacterium]|nr:discoidin domain-containing protein [Armatimonadota bacterium]